MKFVTADQMRKMDQRAIDLGIPGVVLMENAGRGAAVLAQEQFGSMAGKNLAVFCGKGNNGGDGFVMARVFHGWGANVRIYLMAAREDVTGDAKINLESALKLGLELVEVKDESGLGLIDLSGAHMLVDALLGTGLDSEVKGRYLEVIRIMNRANKPTVSVDLPSGLEADTGRILGDAVMADLTVTFGYPKAGHFLPPGQDLIGRLEVVDIGLPDQVMADLGVEQELLDEPSLKGLLKPRSREGHKGDYGHTLILAGSIGKTGAAALAAMAAVRTGSGLVTLAVPESLNPVMEQKLTEPMTVPLPEESPGFLDASAADRILELAEGKSVLVIGPGLSTNNGAMKTVKKLVLECDLPLVIDADGLNVLADDPDILKKVKRSAVLTPHPGEMSRLTGTSTAEIQADRMNAAADFAKKYNLVLALKGYRTVVSLPDGRLFLNTSGGPHMASGGMGDVLTGMIGGLAAQGLSPADAARLAVYVHGLAGDMTAAAKGPVGILASDLLAFLPTLWSRFIG